MQLPKPIYELMPLIYVVSGILAGISIGNVWSFIGGSIFAAVGFLIFTMRYEARNKNVKPK